MTSTGTAVRVAGSLSSSPPRTHSRVETSPLMTTRSLGVWIPSPETSCDEMSYSRLGLGLGLGLGLRLGLGLGVRVRV